MILVLEGNLGILILLKFRIKVKFHWVYIVALITSGTLVPFKCTLSCFHHFDFQNYSGTGINLYSVPFLNKTRKATVLN